jgi:hypothetical protein
MNVLQRERLDKPQSKSGLNAITITLMYSENTYLFVNDTLLVPYYSKRLNMWLSRTKANTRSQWPRGLRRVSAAVRLLGLWVRISPEA